MCQVVMESSNADQEEQQQQLVIEGCIKEAPLCPSSSTSLPPHHTPPPLQPASIPFNLMITSPHLNSTQDSCPIPGSPEFFLPANACISLDDPSSLPPSYSSPSSDTNSIWPHSIPPLASAFLDCPSLFSSAASSHHEPISFYCDQIPSTLSYAVAADSTIDSAVLYDPSLTRLLQSTLHGHHQSSTLNGFHYMMQGSDHTYYSGSSPFGTAYSSASADYNCLHHNAVRAPIDFALANRALYPHNVDGRVNILHQGIVANNEQEQSWHNFLQHDQEDPTVHPESEALKGPQLASGNTVMVEDHHDQLARSLHGTVHPRMPTNNHDHPSIGNSNARSPTQQQMQLTRLRQRADIIDTAFTCSIKPSNKRRTPDGEAQDSWPPAGSPPLKMMRSPSLSSTMTSADLHMPSASPNFINSYNVKDKFNGAATSCNSAALSPSTQKSVITNSGSPTNQPDHHQKRPTKASTRQSVCNDPQSVAARHRRERISERLKTLQQLVPNGSKVDLVTMLEKAISYVKSLQLQVKVLSSDEYWPTPLSDKYSLNNLAVVAKLAASTYS